MYKVGEPVFLVTEIMDAYIGHKTKKERYEIFVNGEVIPIGNDDILIPNPIAKIQARLEEIKDLDCSDYFKLHKIEELNKVLKWFGEE